MAKKELIKITGRYSDDKGQEGILAELPEIKIIGDKNKYLANKWNKENPQSTSEIKLKKTNDGLKKEYNPGAGYLSAYDPIAVLPVEAAVLNPAFKLAGKGFNLIKNAINNNKNNKLTENLLKFIGERNIDFPKIKPERLKGEKLVLYKKLKENGIDINKLSNTDLNVILRKRKFNIDNTAPKNYNIHSVDEFDANKELIELYNNGNKSGYIDLINNDNKYNIDFIEKNVNEKGISEKLYNSAINVAKQNKMDGLVSGKFLKQPQKTLKILDKYKNKSILNNEGEYDYYNLDNSLDFVSNQPVYLLKKPTNNYIPTKSKIFNPSIIDSKGNMHIDWNNKDIYKGIIPLGVLNFKNDEKP